MFKTLGHIACFVAASAMLFSCAGSSVAPEGEQIVMPVGETVNLSFSVVVTDAAESAVSRGALVTVPDDDNYFEREASEYEKINSLRVIILRTADNAVTTRTVEHNRLFNIAADGSAIDDVLRFPVRGGEKKTIYLIANEAAVDYDFNSLKTGDQYIDGSLESVTMSARQGALLINNSASSAQKSYIPMGEVYDCYVPEPKEKDEVFDAGTFFVTRAAVKFSFNVTALYGDGLYLSDITVNGLADKEYLLPNKTDYYPPKRSPGFQNPPTVPDPNLSGHFITSYSIPDDATHGSFTFLNSPAVALSTTPVNIAPALYFCESKLSAAADGAPYTVSITLTDADGGNVQRFDAVPLPNLPLLPRNTHVKVNITLAHADVTCEVEVVPYTGVWLNPDFGIDRE